MQNISVIEESEIKYIAVDEIKPNPYQPRKFYSKAAMEELTRSIRKFGVMQPINVRYINNSIYELVSGERRLRASKLAGLKTIPVVMVNISDRDSAVLALVENMQNSNLNYIEEAEGIEDLMMDFRYSPNEVAHLLGVDLSVIKGKMEILKLSEEVKRELIKKGLSESYAKALLRLDKKEKQIEIVNRVEKYGLNIKRTEELISGAMSTGRVYGLIEGSRSKIKKKFKDVRLFTNTIKQAVELMNESGMRTVYEENSENDGCEITIRVKM